MNGEPPKGPNGRPLCPNGHGEMLHAMNTQDGPLYVCPTKGCGQQHPAKKSGGQGGIRFLGRQ